MINLFSILGLLILLFTGAHKAQEEDVGTTEGQQEEEQQEEENVITDSFTEDVTDDDGDDDEQQQIIGPSPDVEPFAIFPRYPHAHLPIGRAIEILIGFKNWGEKTFNVTNIHGSFRYSVDPSIVIQNFTAWKGGVIVRSSEHFTFQYYFYPDELLEPKDYHFIVTASYSDEDTFNYTSTFYNGTVEMIEEGTPLDFQTFFTSFLILGVLGLIGYVVYTNYLSKKISSLGGSSFSSFTSSQSQIERGTVIVDTNANDYLNDSNINAWKKNKQMQKKKAAK